MRREPQCGLIQRTILSPEMELYLSPEVELLPMCAWRLHPIAHRMLYMLMSTCMLLYSPKCLSVRPGMPLRTSYRLPGMPGVGKTELRNPAPCWSSVEKTSSGRTCGPKERDWDTAPHFLLPHLTASCRGRGHLQGGERLREEKQMSREFIHFFCLCLPPSALLAAKEGPLALERTQLPLQAAHRREGIRGLETRFAV